MTALHNEYLDVRISPAGAELKSIRDTHSGFEYLWQADKTWWGRTSPVLFPVVGKLKNDELRVNGNSYVMTQHGFARDCEFDLVENTASTAVFELKHNEHTLLLYPYAFTLRIIYALHGRSVRCTWQVINSGTQSMYFSIGAHPGFNLVNGAMHEYDLQVQAHNSLQRLHLSGGLFLPETTPFQELKIPLNAEVFKNDALVVAGEGITGAQLVHRHSGHRVSMHWSGFSYLGIWSPKNCTGFVCIEPWCGRADDTTGHSDISSKPAMINLQPGLTFERSYTMQFES
jgi:galactose mutarotase-like enzyme